MPYIIKNVNGKPFGMPGAIFLEHELERLSHDGNLYKVVNVVTRKVSFIGDKKKPAKRKKRVLTIRKSPGR